MFSTFLLTGMREQEVMYVYWTDLNVAYVPFGSRQSQAAASIQSGWKSGKSRFRANS